MNVQPTTTKQQAKVDEVTERVLKSMPKAKVEPTDSKGLTAEQRKQGAKLSRANKPAAPARKSAPKPKPKPEPKPAAKPKASKPKTTRTTNPEHRDLAKRAFSLNVELGFSSSFNPSEAALLLSTMTVTKRGSAITIKRNSDGASATFKRTELAVANLDAETKKKLRAVSSDLRKLYPRKVASFVVVMTAGKSAK